MRNHFVIYSILLSLTSFGQSPTEIAKNGISSTVSVVALDNFAQPLAYGSGFIIDDQLIATNIHVIEGASSAYILTNGVQKHLNVIGYVAIDKVNDLVILKVSDLQGTKLWLDSTTFPEIGEKIYAVGNPKGLNGTFSEGIVSGIREIDGHQVLQITAPISPGSSGGPVLNSKGEVIGIAFASFSGGQNLNFAIPVKYLQNLKAKISLIQSISSIKQQSRLNTKPTLTTPNIKDGVLVRNLSYSQDEVYPSSSIWLTLSIKNNLPYTISDIDILILFKDNTGTVVDYYETTFLNYNPSEYLKEQGIKPYLAHTLTEGFPITYQAGYKLSARVLNYKILEGK